MSRNLTIVFFAVVAAQMIGLVTFAAAKQYVVSSGTEVVLQGAPVDPRSLMQGDYAILDYEIADIPEDIKTDFAPGYEVIVVLVERDEVWMASRYLGNDRIPKRNGEVFIRGQMQSSGRIDFGIGTYFVPEGTGREIERARDLKIRVSVSEDGDATVTGVIADGEDFDP